MSEHPAPPNDIAIASVWTAPWTQILRAPPDVHLHIMPQWKWGCAVIKPTGLLALRLPHFAQSMYQRQVPDAVQPTQVAIGKGPDGPFQISAFEEYALQFCSAIAGSIYSNG